MVIAVGIVMVAGQGVAMVVVVVVGEKIASNVASQGIGPGNVLTEEAVGGSLVIGIVVVVMIDMEGVILVMVVDMVVGTMVGIAIKGCMVVIVGLTDTMMAMQGKGAMETVMVGVVVIDTVVGDQHDMKEAIKTALVHMSVQVVGVPPTMIATDMRTDFQLSYFLCHADWFDLPPFQ